jgi:hypothetical protein
MDERRIMDIILAYWEEQWDYINGVDNFEIGYVEREYRSVSEKLGAAYDIIDRLKEAGFDVFQKEGA